jgi:hypothetical protein
MTTTLLKTSLTGKVNNLPEFKGEALLPIFEAVVNAIQAIEEYGDVKKGKIIVRIKRDGQNSLSVVEADKQKIIGFEVIDNGIGFTELNYDSFLTSDTVHKMEKGCKGIGRFFWLKAFNSVNISSTYTENRKTWKREIRFTKKNGIAEISKKQVKGKRQTVVSLDGFREEYRKQKSAYKSTEKIAQRILEHCLSYFIAHQAPKIIIEDELGDTISLNSEFDAIEQNIVTENVKFGGQSFKVSHLKLYSTHNKMHNLVLCAASRGVKSFNIGNLLGTSTQFDEDDGKFIYSAYVSGDYLDEHVSQSRIDFEIPSTRTELAIEGLPLYMDELKGGLIKIAKDFLAPHLEALAVRKKEIASEYVEQKNPTLRAVLTYCPEIYDEIDPNSSEEQVDEILHKYKAIPKNKPTA